MQHDEDPIDFAMRRFWEYRTFQHHDRQIEIACFIRTADHRPLKAKWWRGKQVSLFAVDADGNFLLRHSDGSVRYWDHKAQREELLALSIRAFVQDLKETNSDD